MPAQALVIGLDSSTQSTKAIAWNKAGELVAEGRADIPMCNPEIGHFEQDPHDWWQSCLTALKQCIDNLHGEQYNIHGLAISNQRETLGFIGDDHEPSHPAMVWLDERSRQEIVDFSASFGAENIHRITGRAPDLTPALYRFIWLRNHNLEAWNNTRYFVDVQSYLVRNLCGGDYRNGWISADPMGIVDMQSRCWSTEILDAIELDESKLPTMHPPGTRLGTILPEVAKLTGLPLETQVFAAGGDGQCAGLGTNCTVPDRAYVNLGTAVVSGIWSPEYRYNTSWRTELAAQGNGYIYENCLRSGAFLMNWFVDQFVAHGKASSADFERLEKAASDIPIGSEGLLVQPYFSGAMDPHWDSLARGVFLGLCPSHTEAHVYRALMESITLDQVMRTMDMEQSVGYPITHFVAIGGGANSPLWRQMLADASGKPVQISPTVEASALGAGMIAAYGAGWFNSIEEAAEGMSGETTSVLPDMNRTERYKKLLSIYRRIYKATAEINHDLVAFSELQDTLH